MSVRIERGQNRGRIVAARHHGRATERQSPGCTACRRTTDLPHDRVIVQRFRGSFPRARRRDSLNAWFVPGRTAERGIGRWFAEMEAEADAFADEKGRDAFAVEPIDSRYLETTPSAFQIQTPYSRTVVNEIREIPFARWDAGCRLWTVPYRSFDNHARDGRQLRRRPHAMNPG